MNILVSALTFFMAVILIMTIFRGIGLEVLFNWEALVIILGGTTAGLMIGYPIERLKGTLSGVFKSFKDDFQRERTIENILAVARLYRKSEIRSLERLAACMDDSFMKLGVNLLINYHKSEDIRSIMERELTSRLMGLHSHQNVLKTAARLAPSLGLAGTVISLIKMFGHMTTAEAMMPLMAVALMSTFYGVIISNLIFMPLHAKLKDIADASEAEMLTVIEGITAIHSGCHPLKVEEMLRGGWIYENSANTQRGSSDKVLAAEPALRGRI